MKRFLFFQLMTAACIFMGHAVNFSANETSPNEIASGDTTSLMSIDKIAEHETQVMNNKKHDMNLTDAWSKNTFLNLIFNTSHVMSSKEFPTTGGVLPYTEYEREMGFGLEWGQTFNFHRKPLGSVLFIGLDYTWMDLEYNKFKKATAPVGFETGDRVHNMPWHNEKQTLGYGMSFGPAFTIYPFSSFAESAANQIRMHLYFHVGYGVEFAFIKDAVVNTDGVKTGHAFGHGLYTAFGGSLTWNFVGIGYEFRNDPTIRYKALEKANDTGKLKMKEKTGRLFIQFRF